MHALGSPGNPFPLLRCAVRTLPGVELTHLHGGRVK